MPRTSPAQPPLPFPTPPVAGYARIAVERGIDRYPDGLTYAIPVSLADLRVGERVRVPLGVSDRLTAGWVVDASPDADTPPAGVKLIASRDDAVPGLPESLIALARWISGYYCAPLGITLAAIIPAAVKRNVGAVMRTMVDLRIDPRIDLENDSDEEAGLRERLPAKQRAVDEVLSRLPPADLPIEMRELATRAELRTMGPIKRLIARGVLETTRKTAIEASWSRRRVDERRPATLTPDQQRAVDAIGRCLGRGFSAHLVFGVTGSGKTEVYLRLLESVVAAGRTGLVLVPEISLTPQTAARLLGRFPRQRVAILHSALTAAQRHQQWSLVASGEAKIVLGARSAVFAPIPQGSLGIVIVDEEHDGSYKQDQAPRYHGRDVAVRRAQLEGCPVVLGSATPSLESWYNATERDVYTLHELPRRVPGLRRPTVHVVDFAEERRKRRDRRVHLLGPILEEALRRTLQAGGQALLLLNRRGYANYIACPDHGCGWVMTCDDCDVTVVYHRAVPADGPAGGFVQCHHCRSEQRLPLLCPACRRRVTTFGLGTQRVEEELARKFSSLEAGRTMLRVDSDTMRSARDLHDALERFGAGEIRVLIGTQMIAKGLDEPGVQLVGVINADTALNLPDFRATERTFQLVSQVAGRTGRSTDPRAPAVVIVQSFNPASPAITLAAAHAYRTFARRELEERRGCGLPPLSRMARIVVRDADYPRCVALATAVAEGLRSRVGPTTRVGGPAPCPISRIAGRHRQQIELLAPTATDLQQALTTARNDGIIVPGAAIAVDVDPTALL